MMPLRPYYPFLLLLPTLYVAPGSAIADIYTWADASGHVTYSDSLPPKGTRLIGVTRDAPVKPLTEAEMRDAEMRKMSQRIQLLEREVQLANQAPPPQPQYASAPYPAPCDWRWANCGSSWPPRYFSPPVALIRVPFSPSRFGGERQFGSSSGFHHGGGGRRR